MGTKKEDRALVFIFKTVLIGQVLVLNQKEKKKKEKKKKREKSSFVAPHKSPNRSCPRIVAMQAVSGSRKDCDSFLTE